MSTPERNKPTPTPGGYEGRKEIEMMTFEEMKEYLLNELKEERNKMLMKEENNYSYIFMLCNDMGIIEE